MVYEGEFDDGMFHGQGDLIYPSGAILRGTWKKGRLIERKLIFAEGLEYSETDWKYCRMPDRRLSGILFIKHVINNNKLVRYS